MGLFGHPVPLMQDGFLFQCFVYHRLKELTQHTSIQIHYWRTTNKAEVDFVLDNAIDLIPIEVKFQTLTRANPGKSMLSFISTYHPKKAYVIHLGEEMHRMYEETEIIVLPYYKLPELLPKEVV
jgi:predicted AAA+ superfamily ATPase